MTQASRLPARTRAADPWRPARSRTPGSRPLGRPHGRGPRRRPRRPHGRGPRAAGPWAARTVADPGQPAPWAARTVRDPELLAADIGLLREGGYLKLAVPVRLGGAGLNLRQVACAQRWLAARAPAAAFAVNAHHAWIGAAADTLASGGPADPVARWLLREAAQGGFIAGWPGPATGTACGLGELEALAGDPPGWDWAGTPVTDDSRAGRPARDTPSPAARAAPGPCPPCRQGRRGTR